MNIAQTWDQIIMELENKFKELFDQIKDKKS